MYIDFCIYIYYIYNIKNYIFGNPMRNLINQYFDLLCKI